MTFRQIFWYELYRSSFTTVAWPLLFKSRVLVSVRVRYDQPAGKVSMQPRVPRQRLSPIGGAARQRAQCAPNSDQAMANTAGSKTSVRRRTLLAAMR